jgi:phosphate transport system substrate-binding protein
MKKIICFVVAVFVLAVGFTASYAIAADWSKPLTVKGSDTMVILNQRWAETWMKHNPTKRVQVTGGGSGTGIAALINGTTDIGASSRPLKAIEIKKIQQKWGSAVLEVVNSKDGLSVYMHKSNPLKSLTMQQIKDIFTGKINNWKEIGGKDTKVIRYSRESNSGTYVFFKDNVLKKEDYASDCQNMPGTAAVVNAVSKDINGIGYGGAAYAEGIRVVSVSKDDKSPAFEPTEANVASNKYPISRNLHYYISKKLYDTDPRIKEFVEFICSTEGQSVVAKVGYFPVKGCQITEKK